RCCELPLRARRSPSSRGQQTRHPEPRFARAVHSEARERKQVLRLRGGNPGRSRRESGGQREVKRKAPQSPAAGAQLQRRLRDDLETGRTPHSSCLAGLACPPPCWSLDTIPGKKQTIPHCQTHVPSFLARATIRCRA